MFGICQNNKLRTYSYWIQTLKRYGCLSEKKKLEKQWQLYKYEHSTDMLHRDNYRVVKPNGNRTFKR